MTENESKPSTVAEGIPSSYYPPPPTPPTQGQPAPQAVPYYPPPPPTTTTVQPNVIIISGPPGMKVLPPRVPPQPGMQIIGWEANRPETGCCQCEDLSVTGWLLVIVLLLVFFPIAWIPCLLAECHEQSCRPVYGYPPPPSQQQQQQQQFVSQPMYAQPPPV